MVLNTRIRYIRPITLFVASQAAIAILFNQRQELALLFFIPTIIAAPLLLRSGLNLDKSSIFSIQVIAALIMMLAIVSNMSYFAAGSYTPFEHWVRLLFPLFLVLLAIKIFQRNESEIKIFVNLFIMVLGLAVFKTFDASKMIALQHGIERQTNWGNAVAALSPFIFLLKSKPLKNTILCVAVVALVISLKRTGFLAAAALILAYFWPALAAVQFKRGMAPSKIRAVLVATAVFTGGAFYLAKSEQFASYLMRAETRLLMALADGGSGRVSLWLSAIDLFGDASFFELLFGRGFGWYYDNFSSLGFTIESLHNDPLEFLISFGLLGALLYVLFASRVISLAIAFRRRGAHASFAIALALIFCIYSIFSGVFFYVFFFTPIFVGIGYLEAQRPNKQIFYAQSDSVPAQ